MSGLSDLDALVSGPSSSSAQPPASHGLEETAEGNAPGRENSSDGSSSASANGEQVDSVAPAPVPAPAAPSSPTLAARRPRLPSLGSSARCRMNFAIGKLSIFGGQAALPRFEERGGMLYCTAAAEGKSEYWNHQQVCRDCHVAGREYVKQQRARAMLNRSSAAAAAGKAAANSSSSSSTASSSSSAAKAKRMANFRDMFYFLKSYLTFFQNETLQLGPDPLASMKSVCQKALLYMKQGRITRLSQLGDVLRKCTRQILPDKPGLFQMLVNKIVLKRNELEKQRAQKVKAQKKKDTTAKKAKKDTAKKGSGKSSGSKTNAQKKKGKTTKSKSKSSSQSSSSIRL